MTSEPFVSVGATETKYHCDCGWSGLESALSEWDVQVERDRVVRVCPECATPVPEWGTLRPIDGVEKVASGDLESALERDQATE
ncbi:hypothetical protein [Haloarcula salina]|uniref:Uncharacterized protein n=1 Tax=Haloarcula salina TaxID=1429914 RepID=A0AA41KGV2_9EURY|nr:hypothetical protein [Haloarcula salina]MBV0903522.1 hypothetical protein [Haloarcula salina]